MNKPPLIVLTGPTAAGKTELSIALAKKIGGEIISADSVAVYKELDIGSAKISPDEMDGIKHHLIDCLSPDEQFDAYTFKVMAEAAIKDIYSRGNIPIIVGGTGFYIQAVLYDVEFKESNENEQAVIEEYESILNDKGNEYLHSLLKEVDPESAETIPANNTRRVVKALAFYKLHSEKLSDHNKAERAKESAYNSLYIVLNKDRDKLYKDIDRRVDIMLERGLVEELKSLYAKYEGNTDINAFKAIGYKELVPYLKGECSLQEAADEIKINTRHFAKRQLTWFRREKDVIWLDKEKLASTEEQLQYITDLINDNNIMLTDV